MENRYPNWMKLQKIAILISDIFLVWLNLISLIVIIWEKHLGPGETGSDESRDRRRSILLSTTNLLNLQGRGASNWFTTMSGITENRGHMSEGGALASSINCGSNAINQQSLLIVWREARHPSISDL